MNTKISLAGKTGYSFGAIACAFGMMLPTLITFFMTETLAIPVAIASAMIAIVKIFDGFTDIIVGTLVDRTKNKYGKARPWFLWAAVPYGVCLAAIFWVPAGFELWTKVILVAIFDILTVSVFGTMLNVARFALISRMSNNPGQKNILSILGDGISSLACGLMVAVVPNMAAQMGWKMVYTIFGILAVILCLVCFLLIKEDKDIMENYQTKYTFKELFGNIVKNKFAITILLAVIVQQLAVGCMQLGGLYYFTYVIGDMNLYQTTMLISIVVGIVGMFVAGIVMKFTSRTFGIAAIGAGICLLLTYFFGSAENGIALIVLLGLSLMCLMTICGSCYGALSAQAVEYGEWKTGVRSEGLTSSAANIGQKIGGALGAALLGSILARGGFQEGGVSQVDTALVAIKSGYLLVPAILAIAIGIVFVLVWNLGGRLPQMREEIAARRAAEEK